MRSALVSSSDANSALIDDGAAGARTIIPTEPGGNLTADLDGGGAGSGQCHQRRPRRVPRSERGRRLQWRRHGQGQRDQRRPDGFLAANKNADFSGGTAAGDTAFVDDSESYLTKVGYDANAATSAVTDAHDRGDGATTSAVTDAHDRGDVTRIDDDADGGGTNAASDSGPNISS